MIDLDDLAEQAIRETPTKPPAFGAVRQRSRRRVRRRRAIFGGGVVAAGMLIAVSQISLGATGTTDVVADGEEPTGTTAQTPADQPPTSDGGQPDGPDTTLAVPRMIRGILPSGDAYEVESTALTSTVTGISAGIVIDEPDGPRAIGIVNFRRSEDLDVPSANDSTGEVAVRSGDWTMRVSIYEDVRPSLGQTPASNVAGWIDASEPTHPSRLPSFGLSGPLRWATDDELPLQMQVQYTEFLIRRGCSANARACSGDQSVQVIAAEDIASPAPSWPDGDVRITAE